MMWEVKKRRTYNFVSRPARPVPPLTYAGCEPMWGRPLRASGFNIPARHTLFCASLRPTRLARPELPSLYPCTPFTVIIRNSQLSMSLFSIWYQEHKLYFSSPIMAPPTHPLSFSLILSMWNSQIPIFYYGNNK